MLRAIGSLLALVLAVPTSSQTTKATDFVSPCPNVFTYEPPGTEVGKWYGVINLTTDTVLYALWLNIVLDSKADILGNWVGEVSTDDNVDFKIENTKMNITPDSPVIMRFFIQYNAQKTPPKLKAIRFNGREVCNVEEEVESEIPVRLAGINYDQIRPGGTISSTVRPTTTSRSYDRTQTTLQYQYWQQTEKSRTTTKTPYWTQTTTVKPYWTEATTTSKPQYWQQTTLKPLYWTQTKSEDKTQTTVRPQVGSHVKVNSSQHITTTVQATRAKPNSTENNSVSKVQTWSNTKENIQQIPTQKTQNKTKPNHQTSTGTVQTQYKTENTSKTLQTVNEIKRHTTEKAPVWPNVQVTDNQHFIYRNTTHTNNSRTEDKQVVPTQFWAKIPAENKTGAADNLPQTESISYIWSENQKTSNDRFKQTHSKQDHSRPTDSPIYVRPGDRQTVNQQVTGARPLNNPGERTPSWTGDISQSWSGQSNNNMKYPSSVDSLGYIADDDRIKNLDDSELPHPAIYKTPNDEYEKPKKEEKIEYYVGGLPIFYIPDHGQQSTDELECGKVLLNKGNSYNRKSSSTLEGQWPWQVALYQQQTSVDFRYICGGTLVAKRYVITAAHCVTKKRSHRVVNKNTLTVYLGKHNLRTSVEGVQVKFVSKILVHPEYNGTNFKRDLAILELRDAVTYSDRVQPACLWPENEVDLKYIVGQRGSVVGWGYEVSGVSKQELSLLEMPVVEQRTCINAYADYGFTSDKTYCAAYRDSGSACNGDSGGGMVFEKGDSWYLRGVVSLSVARKGDYRCDPNNFVIFTDVAKFLPWIEDNIDDYY